jgi:lipid-binding SYLF domain-containing protein
MSLDIGDVHMKSISRSFALVPALLLIASVAHASKYTDTINLFRNAGESSTFFHKCHGYAVFPTVGEGGLGVGGAFGKGRVYVHGQYVGDTTMGQVSVGLQAGGKAFSQIIFFEDKRALDEFESGSFEFAAGASAIAVTAGASASAGTSGASASASAGQKDARTMGEYEKGVVVFTIAKGGLMYAATVAGQKFSYSPRGARK